MLPHRLFHCLNVGGQVFQKIRRHFKGKELSFEGRGVYRRGARGGQQLLIVVVARTRNLSSSPGSSDAKVRAERLIASRSSRACLRVVVPCRDSPVPEISGGVPFYFCND